MLQLKLPKLYPITDRRLTGLSHSAQIRSFIEGGATFIQLREKHLSPREVYPDAVEAVRIAREHGVRVIINDRVDMALALRADGVHLGQDDLPPEAARRVLGEKAIIGFSTHNVEQAIAAARLPINYIAIGPIFATSSKENPDPVVGLDGLREVRDRTGSTPLVAIGGINEHNAAQALAAGADAVAIISALLVDPTGIVHRTGEFLKIEPKAS